MGATREELIRAVASETAQRGFRDLIEAVRGAVASSDHRALKECLPRLIDWSSAWPGYEWIILESNRDSANVVIDALLSTGTEVPSYYWADLIGLVDDHAQQIELVRSIHQRLESEDGALMALAIAVASVRDGKPEQAQRISARYLEEFPGWQSAVEYWLCDAESENVRLDDALAQLQRGPERPDLIGVCRRWRRHTMRPAHVSLALASETFPVHYWQPDVFGYVPPSPGGERGLYIGRSYRAAVRQIAWSFIVATSDEEARHWMRHLPVYDEGADVEVHRLYDVHAKRSGISRPWPMIITRSYLHKPVSWLDHTGFKVPLELMFGPIVWGFLIVDPLRPYALVHEYASTLPPLYQQALATGLFG